MRVVREDPVREGLLYAGTEFGMFVSFDDGEHWQSLQLNLPAVPVTDIKVVDGDLVLSTMGRSFWILYNVSPLRQISDAVVGSAAHLFAPRDAVRFRGGGGRSSGQRRPADPQYPRMGANIDYWLAGDSQGELTLDILDARGQVIRQLSSASPGETVRTPEPGMRDGRLERTGTPRLELGAGMHRYTWDLRYPGPWHPAGDRRRSGQDGPMVPPGKYTARLSNGDWSSTVRDTYSAANHAVARISEATATLGDDLPAELREIRDALGGFAAPLHPGDAGQPAAVPLRQSQSCRSAAERRRHSAS